MLRIVGLLTLGAAAAMAVQTALVLHAPALGYDPYIPLALSVPLALAGAIVLSFADRRGPFR